MLPEATQSRTCCRLSFRVPSVRGSSRPGHAEMPRIFWWSSSARLAWRTSDCGSTPGSVDDDGVHALFGAASDADHRDVAHAGSAATTRSTSSGKTLSPSGVTIISFLRPLMKIRPSRVHLADVAGVKPPALECLGRGLGGAEVALRDVLAPHEDLAVVGDLHLDAGDGLADRSLAGAERMVEADDGRRLGEAVALDHHEAEPAPELLERRIERRGADDEAPELQSEEPVRPAIAPPAPA